MNQDDYTHSDVERRIVGTLVFDEVRKVVDGLWSSGHIQILGL